MWFLNQLDPETSAYNLPQAVRLRGRLDVEVLHRCFTELVRRHETLRTTFAVAGGQPVQRVQPPAPISLGVVDLRPLPPAVREAESIRWASQESSRPFDLSRDPLIRAMLLCLDGSDGGETEHALLLTLHHICADGWSLGVLVREIAALYQAFSAGEGSPLPELPIQYVDFSAWQREVLTGEVLEGEVSYWRGKLAGGAPPLLLPADRRRATVQGFQAGVGTILLPAAVTEGVRRLSRRHSASLYMTLLAAWKTLLSRVTGEEDVLLGAPIANRNRAEIEGLIGFFLNTLVLRTDVSGDPGFPGAAGPGPRDLPRRLRAPGSAAGTGAQGRCRRTVMPGRTSPFQVMFLLQNMPRPVDRDPGASPSRSSPPSSRPRRSERRSSRLA